MELLRYVVAAVFFGLATYGYFSFTAVPGAITVTEARLYPRGEALLLEAQINNPGRPDRLQGLGSEAASRSLLTADNLIVPGDGGGSLQIDTAHGMLINPHGKVYEGRTIPVTFWFESWGPVRTRATVASLDANSPSPPALVPLPDGVTTSDISLSIQEREDGLWASLSLPQSDAWPEGAAPKATLKLNGLYLRDLSEGEAPLGRLPPGSHFVTVTLQKATGERYSDSGREVAIAVSIVVE